MPVCSAVIRCSPPNNTFDAVSDPVNATPVSAEQGAEEGVESSRLRQRETESVASVPEYLVTIPQGEHGRDRDQRSNATRHRVMP